MSKKFYILCTIILLSVLTFLSIKIYQENKIQYHFTVVNSKIPHSTDLDDYRSTAVNNKISYSTNLDNYRELYGNVQIVSILEIADTKTLVVQGNDNEYYLNHLVDKSYNILGSVFLDYRTDINSKKIIIYGHSSNKFNVPLNVLENYSEESFYKKNSIIKIKTDDKEISYKIFSIAKFQNDFTYSKINVDDFLTHVNYLKKSSLYDTGVEVNADDSIILLQTCSRQTTGAYIVICGKKIKTERMIK